MSIIGHVETLAGNKLRGWAARVDGAVHHKAVLEILLDGVPATQVLANIFRPDLLAAGIGDGVFAFEADLSDLIRTNARSEVKVQAREISGGEPILTVSGEDFLLWKKPRSGSLSLSDVVHTSTIATTLDFSVFRKVAIFAVYSRTGNVYKAHHTQILELQNAGYYVIVVRAADQSDQVEVPCHMQINRRNVGHDFGSWWTGITILKSLHPNFYTMIDTLVILNDSCFGYLDKRQLLDAEVFPEDAVGVCESFQEKHHLQTFFVMIKGNFLKSGAFTSFILEYTFPQIKFEVILAGEIGLSECLRDSGGQMRAILSYRDLAATWRRSLPDKLKRTREYHRNFGFKKAIETIEINYLRILQMVDNGEPLNPSHYFWEEVLESGLRLAKRELVIKNPEKIPDPQLRANIINQRIPQAQIEDYAREEHGVIFLT